MWKTLTFAATLFTALLILACNSKDPVNPSNQDDDLTGIAYAPTPYKVTRPTPEFPEMEIPADNPMTVEGIALGRRLFYDPILSGDSTLACAGCHLPAGNFTDNKAVSKGITNMNGRRSAMPLVDVGYYYNGLFWDGRVKSLEEQALKPVEDPIEMHNTWPNAIGKLVKHKDYPRYFRQAFGISSKQEITKELAAKAMAQFERTLVSSGKSRYDRFRAGDFSAFNDDELNGYLMFFQADQSLPDAQCGHCHNAPLFTTNEYLNNGLDTVTSLNDFKDKGRGEVTGVAFNNGQFRTPTLRNIELSAPYMHDGRHATLEAVMDHYMSGGHFADNLSGFVRQIKLTQKQRKEVLAFMKTLTDTAFVNNPAFQNPFK